MPTGHFLPGLKKCVQGGLRRLGLYHRLQASRVYDLYWRIADRSIVDAGRKELEFYRNLLGEIHPTDLIFDVGANHGTKTEIFLKLGAEVLAVEPDNTNQEILRQKFQRYRLHPKPVTILGKALGDTEAVVSMWVDEPGSAKNTLSPKWVNILRDDQKRFGHALKFADQQLVETTTLEQLMVKYGVPRFIKIDVEGYENTVLRGMRRPVPYLSFEVNLPEFRMEGLECIQQLERVYKEGVFNFAVGCCEGLVLDRWIAARDFSQILDRCAEKSIEVFWKTSAERL